MGERNKFDSKSDNSPVPPKKEKAGRRKEKLGKALT